MSTNVDRAWTLPRLPVYGDIFYQVCRLRVRDDDAFG